MLRAICFLIFGFSAVIYLSDPADAQAPRTYVSQQGLDTSPTCGLTEPCKTILAAMPKTSAGGIITCLNPQGFGTIYISKPLAIICPGSIVFPDPTNGIEINTSSGAKVHLEGLIVEGNGTGSTGVTINGGAKVTISNLTIRNFTVAGILLNGYLGARALVQDSIIVGNGNGGINISSSDGSANAALLIRTTVDNHSTYAARIVGPSVLVLDGSKLLGSAVSIQNVSGATVTSLGNNYINGSGAPTLTISSK